MSASLRAQRALVIAAALGLSACSWFTDFKQQPKIDPWESVNDSVPPRANPQGSVPISGLVAPAFMYSQAGGAEAFKVHLAMATVANPVPADSTSVMNGRKLFQINCAVCHGSAAQGMALMKFGIFASPLGATSASAGYPDGQLFAIIRNGKGNMPAYARIEEHERWDIVNYLRTLQGKGTIAADTSHGRPGETGSLVPSASRTAPTRPAPYFHSTPPAAPPAAKTAAPPPTPPDTTNGVRS